MIECNLYDLESVLQESWKRLIENYVSGKIILKTEKDMEKLLAQFSKERITSQSLTYYVKTQQKNRGKIVDLELGNFDKHILVQIKFYHDKADWKETPSMKNTVESDLKFAKGFSDTYIAIIDSIPSTPRTKLQFNLPWTKIQIDEKVFNDVYSTINPKTSPPREKQQNILLLNGIKL